MQSAYHITDITAIIQHAIGKAQNAFGEPPSLVLCILDCADVPLYKSIKITLDLRLGVASQVMVKAKAISGRSNDQYLGNIMAKGGLLLSVS